jgi:meso-butanediol dehydrogenase/(S,S)-butanediol dehydrogenase/diacetyl reductase
MRFEDNVVIVTGAGSGIGAATARRFHAEGAIVALCGRRPAKLAEVGATLKGDRHLVLPTDVTVVTEVEHLVAETLRRFGRIDVVVNNAGTGGVGGFLELPREQWRKVFGVNVDGVFNVTRAALPHLIETRGSIVNVSSASGLGGDNGLNFYNATKGAVSNLTRSLAIEFAPKGVRINAVCPTTTMTDLVAAAFEAYPDMIGRLVKRIPMGRPAEPEEVASVIAFLASEDASFITGVNLPIDGGVTASSGQASFLG